MRRLFAFTLFALVYSIAWSQNQSDFYDINTIQEIRISFKENNWRDILDSLRYNGNNMLAGTVEINKQKFEGAKIRYRSARAFQIGGKRNSLHISLADGQDYQGYNKFELSNALRDPSMVREVLAYEIARKYMPAPKANYAKVQINGDSYGFFVNIESVEGKFLEENFGESDGELYHATTATNMALPDGCNAKNFGSLQYEAVVNCYSYNFDRLTRNGWDNLVDLTKVLHEDPNGLEQVLNIDRTLWMLAFNNAIVNLNSYTGYPSNNYFLYRDKKGQFTPVLGDLNFAFGSFKNASGGSDLEFAALTQLDPLLHAENPDKPLISKLLSNDMYKKIYLSHLRTILYDNFTKGQYEKRAKEIQELIKKSWLDDPNKEYNLVEFNQSLSATIGRRSKIPGITEFMSQRVNFLKEHPDLIVVPPAIADVKVLPREKFSPQQVTEFKIQAKVEKFSRKVHIFYRFGATQEFMEATMLDDGNSNDEQANDDIFGIMIKPQGGARDIEFYIMAENAKSVNFTPSNYMYERHKANLDDLNK